MMMDCPPQGQRQHSQTKIRQNGAHKQPPPHHGRPPVPGLHHRHIRTWCTKVTSTSCATCASAASISPWASTTDALGARQKRPPVLAFAHRQGVLRHCRHVDAVVAHEGETKAEAHRRLRFDVLFIGVTTPTVPSTRTLRAHPRVQVVVLPRTQGVCTSDLWAALQRGAARYVGAGPQPQRPHPARGGRHGAQARARGRHRVCREAGAVPHGGRLRRGPAGAAQLEGRAGGGARAPQPAGGVRLPQLPVSSALGRYPWYPVRGYALKHQNPTRRACRARGRIRPTPCGAWWRSAAGRAPCTGWSSAKGASRGPGGRGAPRTRSGRRRWRSCAASWTTKAQGVVHGDVHGDNVCGRGHGAPHAAGLWLVPVARVCAGARGATCWSAAWPRTLTGGTLRRPEQKA